jgi:tetratricopeptide (TPR) repeat protein
MNSKVAVIAGLCGCLLLFMTTSGCMMWHPKWPEVSNTPLRQDASERLEEAVLLGHRADSRSSTNAAVAAYQTALDVDPENYQAFVDLAQLHLLLGDAYATSTSEKRECFRKAMVYAEGAMFTNPLFRQSIRQGKTSWEASRLLSLREMDAMFFWVNAVFYSYKEGQGIIGQVINFRWIRRAKQVLEHMTSIDPDWGGGALHFTWGAYYLSIPESTGGDRKKSAQFFSKAIEVGPENLLNRWGRAKYYQIKMNDPQGFQDDLEWGALPVF